MNGSEVWRASASNLGLFYLLSVDRLGTVALAGWLHPLRLCVWSLERQLHVCLSRSSRPRELRSLRFHQARGGCCMVVACRAGQCYSTPAGIFKCWMFSHPQRQSHQE